MSRLARIVALAGLVASACHRSEPAARSTPDEGSTAAKPSDSMKPVDQTKPADPTKGTTMNPDVVKALESKGYKNLFMTMNTKDLDEVWALAGGAAGLDAVAESAQASSKARYLAAEIRFKKDPAYKPTDAKGLAKAYADALRDEVIANPWGMPGELDEPLGKHIVALGEPAVPALRELFSDSRSLKYGGSKEATVGNEYAMRVKDFAAFFVAKIRNRPFVMNADPAQRDVTIAELQASL